MWTQEHRRAHARKGLRYPSDLTDPEWELVEPLLPLARRGGRPREVSMREVLNAVFYLLSTGCQWDALPKDLPPKTTVYDYFSLWRSTERFCGCLKHCMRRCARSRGVRPPRRWRSSTARAPKRRKNVWPAPSASGLCRLV